MAALNWTPTPSKTEPLPDVSYQAAFTLPSPFGVPGLMPVCGQKVPSTVIGAPAIVSEPRPTSHGGGPVTVTCTESLPSPLVATIQACPAPTGSTSAVALTTATAGVRLAHAMAADPMSESATL